MVKLRFSSPDREVVKLRPPTLDRDRRDKLRPSRTLDKGTTGLN